MIDVGLIGAPAFAVKVVGDGFAYTGVNRRLTDLTGLRQEDLLGRSPAESLPPAVAEAVLQRYRACVRSGQAIDSETHHALPGGDRWWHIAVTPVLDADGAVSSLVGVTTDITRRKVAERERREAEARMTLAMEILDGGFWHLDLATGDLEITAKLAHLVTGRAADRVSWADYLAGLHPDDRASADVAGPVRGEGDTREYRTAPARDGATRWLRCRHRLVRAEAGRPEGVIGVVVDVTAQRRLQDRLEHQARTDPLTGLANRRGFDDGAERLLRHAGATGRHFGLVVLDLDRFKSVNDRHGHATGDLLLCALAARLRRLVRPGDVVARIGGDEFAILVSDIADDALPRLARRLVRAARRPVSTPVGPLSAGLSIGLATSVTGDLTIGDLAARADRALYAVKLSGRGSWKLAA